MSNYTPDDFADALRDLIANAQDADLTDADLGNWVRLYIEALKASHNPAALAALVEAAAVAWRQRVNPECFCDADVEMATEKLGQALTAFREGSAS